MPRNGTGTYTLPEPPFVPGTIISSVAVNTNFADIAQALTGSVAADGQTPFLGTIKFPNGASNAPGISFSGDSTAGIFYPGSGQLGFAASGKQIIFNFNAIGGGQDGGIITQINGAEVQPVGVIHDFAGLTAPAGWFLCYGQQISRTGYPELFTVIGTVYGPGDGSTTFNLPDLRGFVSAGIDNMGGTNANRITNFNGTVAGANGGEQNHTLSTSELANHGHIANVNDPQHTHLAVGTSFVGTNLQNSAGGGPPLTNAAINSQNLLIQAASTNISVNITNTGGGGGHNNLQPTMVMNKIIFAGRV